MNNQNKPLTFRAECELKYMAARANMILLILITVVDIILIMAKSGMNLLYSLAATVPVYMAGIGSEMDSVAAGIGFGMVGFLLTTPYLLCFIFSKKRYEWMIGAVAYFVLDCIFLAVLAVRTGTMPDVFEILLHAYFLYYFIMGIIKGSQLKKMPEDKSADDSETDEADDGNDEDELAPKASEDDLSDDEERAAEEAEKAFWEENDAEEIALQQFLQEFSEDENEDL